MKKSTKNGLYTLGIWGSGFFGIMFLLSFVGGVTLSDDAQLVIGFFFSVICIVLFIFFINKKKKLNPNKSQNQYIQFKLRHYSGLPIIEGALCEIVSNSKGIKISSSGTNFVLDRSKIVDISIQKDIKFTNQAVSSVGGAIAGAMMFGVVGAAVGGRTKTKRVKDVNKYVVITYKKDENINYIAFDYPYTNGNHNPKVLALLRAYKSNQVPADNQTIEI